MAALGQTAIGASPAAAAVARAMGHTQTHRSRLRASGVHPTPEAPASRTVGSAAPASPMCHIAPWMRLPLAPPFCAHPRRCGGRSRGIALRAEKRGKAPACAWSWKDAVSATRRFESSRPSHPETVGKCGFLAFADFADKAAIALRNGHTPGSHLRGNPRTSQRRNPASVVRQGDSSHHPGPPQSVLLVTVPRYLTHRLFTD